MSMGSKRAPAVPSDGAEARTDDVSGLSLTTPFVPTTSLPVAQGELVAGRYRIDRAIGKGGMGVVAAAHDVELDRAVAIKFLHPRSARDPEFAERFRREARAMAKLTNEHFVRVLDIGELPTGELFLVMEHLEGEDLSALVERQGPLPVPDVVDYVLEACEALAEAHSLGIVHRDLKPSNLYLARRADNTCAIKVLDFGIAKMAPEDSQEMQSLTTTTAFLGSPAYIAPEQLLSARDVASQADIWSLGAILHKLLSGKPPFAADTMLQLCSAISSAPPPRVRDLRPEVPREIQDVILRCLEKEPASRFRSVAELACSLAPFASPGARVSVDRAVRMVGASSGTIAKPNRINLVRAAILSAVPAGIALLLLLGARLAPSAARAKLPSYTMTTSTASFVDACDLPDSFTILKLHDDAATTPLSLPIAFDFFGVRQARYWVNANGVMGFDGQATNQPTTTCPLPNAVANPFPAVYAFAADLSTRINGACVATEGTRPNRRFVVTWKDAFLNTDHSSHLTFSVVLTESTNTVDILYGNMTAAGAIGDQATIGIEDPTGSRSLQFSCHQPIAAVPPRVHFTPSPL